MRNGVNPPIGYPESMKTYTTSNVIDLNPADRKVVSSIINEVLAASAEFTNSEPFYFECRNTMVMFAPETHFFFDIPDAPLPSLGGYFPDELILAGQTAANDRLPSPKTDTTLPSSS